MARTKSAVNPHLFHLLPLKLKCKLGLLDTFEITWEVRELMAIYRAIHGRSNIKISEDIEMFLNSVAERYGYNEFDINEKVSNRNINVRQ
jgi:hypothetical protein